jgi:hypothetical protein
MRKYGKNNKNTTPFVNTSKPDPSKDILEIQDKPDVAVWNKKVRIKGQDKGEVKIGSLNHKLISQDTNEPIDPADSWSTNFRSTID